MGVPVFLVVVIFERSSANTQCVIAHQKARLIMVDLGKAVFQEDFSTMSYLLTKDLFSSFQGTSKYPKALIGLFDKGGENSY